MSSQLSRHHRISAHQLLARILEEPNLPTMVQRLPPSALAGLIDRIGLEDAGEIVALATTEQLAHVFDTDLWKNERPGEEEHFDPERFLVWLYVLLEAGESFAANRIAEMPEDLVTLAFHRQLLVLDIDVLAKEVRSDDFEPHDDMLTGRLHEELDDYQLVAREEEGWDTIITLILALEQEQPEFLKRVLHRCASLTDEFIEDNGGLYEVLSSEEMLAGDVAAEREDRRSEMGYVAPPAAAAFLKSARMESKPSERDPATRAYFRNLSREEPASKTKTPAPSAQASSSEQSTLLPLLKEAGIIDEPKNPLLLQAGPEQSAPEQDEKLPPLFIQTMHSMGESNPDLFAERHEELAYLANVLVAGASFQNRRLRPVEALHGAISTCNIGLEVALAQAPRSQQKGELSKRALAVLQKMPADMLFRMGWRRLHQGTSEPATATALRLLQGKPISRFRLLSRELDTTDYEALKALLDDCPSLAGTLLHGPSEAPEEEAPPEKKGAKPDETPHFISSQEEFPAIQSFLDGLKLWDV